MSQLVSTEVLSKRDRKIQEAELRVQKKTILSTFPQRFTKDGFPKCDSAMKWWFNIDYDDNDHTKPVYLLSVNVDEPDKIYEAYISIFWFYNNSDNTYDFWYNISIEEDANGVANNVIFKDMFRHDYVYTNKLVRLTDSYP